MPLQDLTPQLRTRLSQVERMVGVFVLLAVLLLLAGFAYYLWHRAESKGWFLAKVPFYTYVNTATGLKVGDPVKLMGFDAGEITRIEPMQPFSEYEVYVGFVVKHPYYGYLWSEGSYARVTATDFLGKRSIEVTKGTNGYPAYTFLNRVEMSLADAQALPAGHTYLFAENIFDPAKKLVVKVRQPVTPEALKTLADLHIDPIRLFDKGARHKFPMFVWEDQMGGYVPFTNNVYFLPPHESPALTDRLQDLVNEIDRALPGILNLTNHIAAVLTNSVHLVNNVDSLVSQAKPVIAEANDLIYSARPTITNLNGITHNFNGISQNLNNPHGALGEWLLPANLNAQLQETVSNANITLLSLNSTVTNADTNLVVLVTGLSKSLENLANITSNLNAQVQVNTNILSEISAAIVHSDEFLQGLKRHWLLRSAFKTNAPPKSASPKNR